MIKIPNLRSLIAKSFRSNTPKITNIPKRPWGSRKEKVVLGELVRVTPGGRHAYYESNVGLIRKPIREY